MALIGSGSNAIQNIAADSSLSAGKLDTSLAAVVEQVGGVAWANGAPARYAGNLGPANFASPLSLPNSYKLEPRSMLSFPVCYNSISVDATKETVLGGSACPASGLLDSITFGRLFDGSTGAGVFQGTFKVLVRVNGVLVGQSPELIKDSSTDIINAIDVRTRVVAGDQIQVALVVVTHTSGASSAGYLPVSFAGHLIADHV
jgi:hypothetical protein